MTFWEIYDEYIERRGAKEFKEWLLSTDFETAPASTRYHESYHGGLMEHSVNVFHELIRLLKAYPEIRITAETAAIISLLHDVCKVNSYRTEYRNKKDEMGQWIQVPFYTFKEDFCYGNHGGKSVYLIQRFMPLSEAEATSIQCHMGVENGNLSVHDAFRACPLAFLLHVADTAATIEEFSHGRK